MSATTAPPVDNRFSIALFLAGALHLILLLGLGFDFEPPTPPPPQLAITLAQQRSALTPEDITHLAQFSQMGSGDAANEDRMGGRTSGAPEQAQAREASDTSEATRADTALSARSSRIAVSGDCAPCSSISVRKVGPGMYSIKRACTSSSSK